VPLAIIDHLLQNLARHVGQPDVIAVAILDCELNYHRLEGHRFVYLKDKVVGGLQDHLLRCRRHGFSLCPKPAERVDVVFWGRIRKTGNVLDEPKYGFLSFEPINFTI